jgi:hypothetical protein
MTDHDPTALSGSLLARKGMAGVEGFAAPEVDRSRPDWSRSRTVRIAGLLIVAVALGASGMWLTTHDRVSSGSNPAAQAASEPVEESQAPVSAIERDGRPGRQVEIRLVAGAPPARSDDSDSMPVAPPMVLASSDRPEDGSAQSNSPEPPAERLRSVDHAPEAIPDKPKTPAPAAHLATKGPGRASTHGFRVQLHTLQSRDAVEREWVRLRRRHGDLLGDKQLVIDRLDVSGTGPRYRMQLGNLPTRTAARQLCRALSDRGQKCILVPAS